MMVPRKLLSVVPLSLALGLRVVVSCFGEIETTSSLLMLLAESCRRRRRRRRLSILRCSVGLFS